MSTRNKSCWHILHLQLVDLAVRGRDESAVTESVPSFLIGQLQQRIEKLSLN